MKNKEIKLKQEMKEVLFYPVTSEKIIKMLEAENKIVFAVEPRATKKEIKEEIEKKFKVKVTKISTLIKKRKKIAFIKLKHDTPAIDIATKLGII